MAARQSELSVRRAAGLYNLRRSTLQDCLSGRIKPGCKVGRKPALDEDQEAALVLWLLSSRGVPKNYVTLRTAIKDYLVTTNTPNSFTENR